MPFSVLTAGVLMLLLPVLNYFNIKKYYNISGSGFYWITAIDTVDLILLAVPCMIGIGLLAVKKWAWWSLLFYVSALTLNNTAALFRNQDIFHLSALLQTFVGIALILFFLRKDISAPYFKMYPRGWRGQKRTPVVMDVSLDGTLYKTKDISETGIYAAWIGCAKNLGDAVTIEMDGLGPCVPKGRNCANRRNRRRDCVSEIVKTSTPSPFSISRKDFETEKGNPRRMLSFSQ